MSCGLIFQTQNDIFIAADTAASINFNGTIYRKDEDAKKLFVFDDMVVFCTGNLDLSYKIMDEFGKSDKQIDTLQRIAKENFIQKFGEDFTVGKLDILAGTFLEDSMSVVYQISPYEQFAITEHRIPSPMQFGIWSGGIMVDEALDIAYAEFSKTMKVIPTFQKTYDEVSFEGVGGELIIYNINPAGIRKLYQNPIKEKDIKYVDYNAMITKFLGNVSVDLINANVVRGLLGEFAKLYANQIIMNGEQGMEEVSIKMTHSPSGDYTELKPSGLLRYVSTPITVETLTGVPDTEDFNGEDLGTLALKGWEFSGCAMDSNRLRVGSTSSYNNGWARINKYITKDNTTFNFTYTAIADSDDDHYFYIDNTGYNLGKSGTSTTFQTQIGRTVTLSKGWHTLFWSLYGGNTTGKCVYVDDIIFEQNPVRLDQTVPPTFNITGTTYNYLTYSGTGSTPNSMIFDSADAVPDVWVQLPDEFKGKNFSIDVFLQDTGEEGTDYCMNRVFVEVVIGSIDTTNARFKVRARLKRTYYMFNA